MTLGIIIGFLGVALFFLAAGIQSIFRSKLVALAASFLLGIYGQLIHSWPLMSFGLVLTIYHVVGIARIKGKKESLKILEVQNQSEYLREFIQFYRADIFRYFPNFDFTVHPEDRVFFILRNMAVAGLVISRKKDERQLQIILDYVIPPYRDFKLGLFLYSESKSYFRKFGFEKLVSTCYNAQHEEYLLKMGFKVMIVEQQRCFLLNL